MPDNDDDLYLATLTLDQERVNAAIAPLTPEQRQTKMLLDLSTNSAYIASLNNSRRTMMKDLAATNKRLTDTTAELVEHARDLRAAIDFLEWMFFFGLLVVMVAVFYR